MGVSKSTPASSKTLHAARSQRHRRRAGRTDHVPALRTVFHHQGLVLSDVVMPRLSGPKAVEEILETRPSVQVLYMSGYTDDAIVHHGVLAADVHFIQKPFTPAALGQKVRAAMDLGAATHRS